MVVYLVAMMTIHDAETYRRYTVPDAGAITVRRRPGFSRPGCR
jgi:uncharacterized protein (DUF1330 family)